MATTGVDPAATPTGDGAVDPVPSTIDAAPPSPPAAPAIAPPPATAPAPPRRSTPPLRPRSLPPHRRAHLSIRARVVATFAILLVVALVVATGAIGRVLHQQYDKRVDEELVRTVEGIRRQVAPDPSSAASASTRRSATPSPRTSTTLAPRSDEGVLVILDGSAALTTSWSPTRLDDLDAGRGLVDPDDEPNR